MTDPKLLEIARNIEMPKWATHVAVRNDGSKAEPAAWIDKANDYVDEDPSGLKSGSWSGSYKHCYWSFISNRDLLEAGNE